MNLVHFVAVFAVNSGDSPVTRLNSTLPLLYITFIPLDSVTNTSFALPFNPDLS